MSDQVITPSNKEIKVSALNGWMMLLINLGLLALGWFLIIQAIRATAIDHTPISLTRLFTGIGFQTLAVIFLCGHFTLQPNEARALILFGAYRVRYGPADSTGRIHSTQKEPGSRFALTT